MVSIVLGQFTLDRDQRQSPPSPLPRSVPAPKVCARPSPRRCRRASAAIIPDESLQDMVESAGFGGIAADAAIFTHSARSENH